MKLHKSVNVLDVRNSPEERALITEVLKDNNAVKGSKYLKPSFTAFGHSYNASFKNPKLKK